MFSLNPAWFNRGHAVNASVRKSSLSSYPYNFETAISSSAHDLIRCYDYTNPAAPCVAWIYMPQLGEDPATFPPQRRCLMLSSMDWAYPGNTSFNIGNAFNGTLNRSPRAREAIVGRVTRKSGEMQTSLYCTLVGKCFGCYTC